MRHSKKLIGGLAVVTAGILGTGIAYAAWNSSGAGSGAAQSIDSVNSVISTDGSTADLYPGAKSSVTVKITNPNPYPVIVTSISAGSSNVLTGADSDCVAGSVTSDAVADAAGIDQVGEADAVIDGNGTGVYTLTTRMIPDPHDDCKTASFTLPLTALLESKAVASS